MSFLKKIIKEKKLNINFITKEEDDIDGIFLIRDILI